MTKKDRIRKLKWQVAELKRENFRLNRVIDPSYGTTLRSLIPTMTIVHEPAHYQMEGIAGVTSNQVITTVGPTSGTIALGFAGGGGTPPGDFAGGGAGVREPRVPLHPAGSIGAEAPFPGSPEWVRGVVGGPAVITVDPAS